MDSTCSIILIPVYSCLLPMTGFHYWWFDHYFFRWNSWSHTQSSIFLICDHCRNVESFILGILFFSFYYHFDLIYYIDGHDYYDSNASHGGLHSSETESSSTPLEHRLRDISKPTGNTCLLSRNYWFLSPLGMILSCII